MPKPISLRPWILGLLLVLAGCASSTALRVSSYPGTIRIACVGDSITYGSGVEKREENNYPKVLNNLFGPKFEVSNFGVSGATLLKHGDKPYWNEKAFLAASNSKPDVVVIKLGTNDTKPQNWKFGNEFTSDLETMIDTFRALPSHPKIYLCIPVPVYATRYGITSSVLTREIIPDIQKAAKAKHVPIIDLYAALNNHEELFPDKIHPNASGARLIAETVKAALTGNSTR
ncbi:MAG: hypothetical protein JWN25_1579 [Verrucomicrobiales bacterium]|nr:hypothetical protein [Verrucomicrobiales bacterium]